MQYEPTLKLFSGWGGGSQTTRGVHSLTEFDWAGVRINHLVRCFDDRNVFVVLVSFMAFLHTCAYDGHRDPRAPQRQIHGDPSCREYEYILCCIACVGTYSWNNARLMTD